MTASATLQAIVEAAVEATGAERGWLVATSGDQLSIVAAVGSDSEGTLEADVGAVAYVVSSGQPAALQPRAGEAAGAGGLPADQSPTSVLCVPCTAGDDVVAALEVVDKRGGGAFSFDDVEVVTLLGMIAGPATVELGAATPSVRDPAALSAELHRLATVDAGRYARVATILDALLG